jgi:hypothetical protein
MPTVPHAPHADWRRRARCRSYTNPDDFHPEVGDLPTPGTLAALTCCLTCPVTQACLDAGRGSSGIWGGLGDHERSLAYALGWQPGQPIPPLRATRRWVTLAQAAATLGVARRRVRGWAEHAKVDSRYAPLHYGQPTRLVDLDQCRTLLEAA